MGSPVFPSWAQHTYSYLSSFAGGKLVRNWNSVNDKRRHQVVKEATLINKWNNGGRKVFVCLRHRDRVEITISWLLSLLGCKLAHSVRACLCVCVCVGGGTDADFRLWVTLDYLGYIWRVQDAFKTCLCRIICNYRDNKMVISKTQTFVQMYGNVFNYLGTLPRLMKGAGVEILVTFSKQQKERPNIHIHTAATAFSCSPIANRITHRYSPATVSGHSTTETMERSCNLIGVRHHTSYLRQPMRRGGQCKGGSSE